MSSRLQEKEPGARAALVALALLVSLAPAMAGAELTAELKAQGWRELAIPNKADNHFSLGQDGVIEVVSRTAPRPSTSRSTSTSPSVRS